MQQINWDDLHYVLVVARTGSLSASARILKVNRTTVLRRINAFEERLNYQLFERSRSGYMITAEAEQLLSSARGIEQSILDLERQIAGHELQLEGELRVTTTDSILPVIIPHLDTFHRLHPLLHVELAVTNNRLNLTRREADVAVRPTVNPPDNLWGKKIAELAFAVYATSSFIKKNSGKSLVEHDWLGVDEPLSTSQPGRWLRSEIPKEKFFLRADSFIALKMAAEQGLGLALMPCHVGDDSRKLKRLGSPIPELNVGLWILTHADLIRAPRIRTFIDHITTSMHNQCDTLLGIKSRP